MAISASNLLDPQALQSFDGQRSEQITRIAMPKPPEVTPADFLLKQPSDIRHIISHL